MQGKKSHAKTGPGRVTRSKRVPKAPGRTGQSTGVTLSPSPGSPGKRRGCHSGAAPQALEHSWRCALPVGSSPRRALSNPTKHSVSRRLPTAPRSPGRKYNPLPQIVLGVSAAPLGPVHSSWSSWSPLRPSPGEPLWAGIVRRGPSRAGSGPLPGAGQRTGGGDYWPPGPGALLGPARRPTVPVAGGAPPPGHLAAVFAGPRAACAWKRRTNENHSKWRGGDEWGRWHT